MSTKFNLLTGSRILEEVDSPINGKVRVIQSIAWGNHVQAGSLTQSGGVVMGVWRYSLKKVRGQKPEVKSCLILGLGGGSAARLVRKYWSDAEITGVELDPVMIDLGMKYLGLASVKVNIKIQDAIEFCQKVLAENKKYDLVLIDIYVGDKIPEKFETEDFVKNVKELVAENGTCVFNRLFFDENKGYAIHFGKKLEKYFAKVTPIYPEANVMFVCNL